MLYTLKKKAETSEHHIFEATGTSESCTPEKESICKGMNKSEPHTNVAACLNENQMRKKAADIGRPVCGVCVSHLYESY